MNNRPVYSVQLISTFNPPVLIIIDECVEGRMSVTNAAERVISEVSSMYPGLPDTIIYKDSDGLWGRMIVTGHNSVSFAPLAIGHDGKCSMEEAIFAVMQERKLHG